MGTKYTPNFPTSGTSTTSQVRDEFDRIQDALEESLSRYGDVPNQMEADLDMNSNRILNLPKPLEGTEPLRLQDLAEAAGSLALATTETFVTLEDSQAVVGLPLGVDAASAGIYLVGNDVDTGRLMEGVDYTVTGISQITLTETYPEGTSLYIIAGNILTNPAAAADVISVFGRTGVVVPQAGDYDYTQVTGALGDITNEEIGDLFNVNVPTPSADDVLTFNGTNWVALPVGTPSTGITTQEEEIVLNDGQTVVTFLTIETTNAVFYLCGPDADTGRLCSDDYTIDSTTQITLSNSYPSGTKVIGVVGEAVAVGAAVDSVFGRTGAVVSQAGDYDISQITGGIQAGDSISLFVNDSNYLQGITGESLGDLSDVSTSGASTSDVLTFNGSSWAPAPVAPGGSGEANTASNRGTGSGIFLQKSGVDLEFKSLVAGSNVSLSSSVDSITINAIDVGEVNTASNVGVGLGQIFKGKALEDLELRTILGGPSIDVTTVGDEVIIASTALVSGDNVSELVNDLNYVAAGDGVSTLSNDAGYLSNITGEVLTDLSDVNTGGVATNDVLTFNGSIWVAAPLPSSSSQFVGLTDTPANYSGQAGKGLVVNGTENALVFTDVLNSTSNYSILGDWTFTTLLTLSGGASISGISYPTTDGTNGQVLSTDGAGNLTFKTLAGAVTDFTDLADTPSVYTGDSLKAVRVNAGETGLEFYTPPAAGETNTASNVGSGTGLFKQKTASDLEFKTLTVGSSLALTSGTNEVDITPEASFASLSANTTINAANQDTYRNKIIKHTGTGNITITFASDLDTGFQCILMQDNTGTVTVAGSGVTIKSKDSNLSLGGQYSFATFTKDSSSTGYLFGDLA